MKESYAERYWQIDDAEIDKLREFVDDVVGEALTEYVKDGELTIDFRGGGAPTIGFTVRDEMGNPITDYRRDLGDVLLEETRCFEETGPQEMHDLLAALLDTYEQWRKQRALDDKNCNIPAPEVNEDGYAVERDALEQGGDGKWVSP